MQVSSLTHRSSISHINLFPWQTPEQSNTALPFGFPRQSLQESSEPPQIPEQSLIESYSQLQPDI